MSDLNLRIMNLVREISFLGSKIAESKEHRDKLKLPRCKRSWDAKVADLEKKMGEKLDDLELDLQRRRLLRSDTSGRED